MSGIMPAELTLMGRCVAPPWPVHPPASKHGPAVLHGYAPLGFGEHHYQVDHQHADDHQHTEAGHVVLLQETLADDLRQRGNYTCEDDDGDAVAYALLRYQLANPDQKDRSRRHRDDDRHSRQEVLAGYPDAADGAALLEQRQLSEALERRYGHHKVVRQLVDALPARLALAAELLQLREHGYHQLHDDGRRDVWEHAQRNHAQAPQRASAEHVQESKQIVLAEEVGQCLPLHARDWHLGQEPEDDQHGEYEQEPGPELRHPHRVHHCLEKPGCARLRPGGLSHHVVISIATPPAASILRRASLENRCADTESARSISPRPRTFT